jgi:arginine/lysine/ornithine decarboxylase
VRSGRSVFCLPGHKGSIGRFSRFDVTELPEVGDLYRSNSLIERSERMASNIYGSKFTIFSTGGNTLCIQAMLRLFFPNGGKLIVCRNVHRSVVYAMFLLGIEPVWVVCSEFGQATSEKISLALLENPDSGAVFITSPDYFGNTADIKSISKICGNIPVLVDNAHGSHLKLIGKNLHPIDQGASACADSAHKTLPILTGGAFLHVNSENFTVSQAKSAMELFGSTSPSFLTLISIEKCLNWIKSKGKSKFNYMLKEVNAVKTLAKRNGVLSSAPCEPARIVLDFSNFVCDDEILLDYFRKFKIEPEFIINKVVVLIPSAFNSGRDWKRLRISLSQKNISCFKNLQNKRSKTENFMALPEKFCSFKEALFAEREEIFTQESLGRISAIPVSKCPPGLALVMPGEKIGIHERQKIVSCGISRIVVLK